MEELKKAQKSKKTRLRQVLQIIGTLTSFFLFFLLLRKQDWLVIWESLRKLPVWLLIVAQVFVFCGMICNALRWYVLVRAQDVEIPFDEVLRTVFAGAFASNFLPSTVGGDAFRVISLLRYTPDRVLSLASVIVDRVMNIAATFTFLPFAWVYFGNRIFEVVDHGQAFPYAVAGYPFLEKLSDFMRRNIKRFTDTLLKWRGKPFSLLTAFAISWISIFVIYFALWLIARSLGMPITLFQLAGVEFVVYIVTLLPVSFNGIGIREVIYTTLMIELGAVPEHAAALTLISRFFLLLTTTPGALWISGIMNFQKDE